jgi:ubiquinone biosynthesis protein COQ9
VTAVPSAQLRRRWLEAMLPDVPFTGWTDMAAQEAAHKAGLTPGEQALAAPQGVVNLIDALFDDAAAATRSVVTADDLSGLRVTERVAKAVRTWLDALSPHHEAVRKAASRGLLPWGAGPAMQRSWQVADMVWDLAGDTATDYNRYTKRALLAAILPSIVLHWCDQPEPEELDAYILNRLSQASRIGSRAGALASPLLRRASRRDDQKGP